MKRPQETYLVRVGRMGDFDVAGMRYWSKDLVALFGKEVLVRFGAGAYSPSVWDAKGQVRLTTATLIGELDSLGFADPELARRVGQSIFNKVRADRETAEYIRLTALLQIIDHRIDANGNARTLFGKAGINLALRNAYRRIKAAIGQLFGRENVAEQQLLQCEEVIAHLGKLVFGHEREILRSVETGMEPNPVGADAHRLCEGAN